MPGAGIRQRLLGQRLARGGTGPQPRGGADALDLPASRVSQHLSLMRAHRFVEDEREGRKHIYKLVQPEIADWIVEGLDFSEGRMRGLSPRDIKSARALWTGGDPASTPPTTDVNS